MGKLADAIRRKNPGAYDKVDDLVLEQAYVKKHPEYARHMETSVAEREAIQSAAPEPTPTFGSLYGPGGERAQIKDTKYEVGPSMGAGASPYAPGTKLTGPEADRAAMWAGGLGLSGLGALGAPLAADLALGAAGGALMSPAHGIDPLVGGTTDVMVNLLLRGAGKGAGAAWRALKGSRPVVDEVGEAAADAIPEILPKSGEAATHEAGRPATRRRLVEALYEAGYREGDLSGKTANELKALLREQGVDPKMARRAAAEAPDVVVDDTVSVRPQADELDDFGALMEDADMSRRGYGPNPVARGEADFAELEAEAARKAGASQADILPFVDRSLTKMGDNVADLEAIVAADETAMLRKIEQAGGDPEIARKFARAQEDQASRLASDDLQAAVAEADEAVSGGSLSEDVRRAIDSLPEPAEGHTRLYRVEGKTAVEAGGAGGRRGGRWFERNPGAYATDKTLPSNVRYVDVPDDELARLAGDPNATEFQLPDELLRQSQPLSKAARGGPSRRVQALIDLDEAKRAGTAPRQEVDDTLFDQRFEAEATRDLPTEGIEAEPSARVVAGERVESKPRDAWHPQHGQVRVDVVKGDKVLGTDLRGRPRVMSRQDLKFIEPEELAKSAPGEPPPHTRDQTLDDLLYEMGIEPGQGKVARAEAPRAEAPTARRAPEWEEQGVKPWQLDTRPEATKAAPKQEQAYLPQYDPDERPFRVRWSRSSGDYSYAGRARDSELTATFRTQEDALLAAQQSPGKGYKVVVERWPGKDGAKWIPVKQHASLRKPTPAPTTAAGASKPPRKPPSKTPPPPPPEPPAPRNTNPDLEPALKTKLKKVLGAQRLGRVQGDEKNIVLRAKQARIIRLWQDAINAGETTAIEGNKRMMMELDGLTRGSTDIPVGAFTPDEMEALQQYAARSEWTKDAFERLRAATAIQDMQKGAQLGQAQLNNLRKLLGPALVPQSKLEWSLWQKIMAIPQMTAGTLRSLLSMDVASGVLRQAGPATYGHPVMAAKAFYNSMRALVSEGHFAKVDDAILRSPMYDLQQASGLYISRQSKALSLAEAVGIGTGPRTEEAFSGGLIERIPYVGAPVRAAERAYLTYLNKLRSDVFNKMAYSFMHAGITPELNPKVYKDLALALNNETGRGSLGALEKAAPILNASFFAPRFMASRLSLLRDLPRLYMNYEAPVRKMLLKDMAVFIGANLGFLFAGKHLWDMEVEGDMRSSDFAKIRDGRVRLDPWAGFQPWVRLFAQLGSGQRKSSSSGEVYNLGEGMAPSRLDLVYRFLEQKASPGVGIGLDVMRGKNAIGQPLEFFQEEFPYLGRDTLSRIVPMFLQDMEEVAQEADNELLAVTVPASNLGWGVQVYDSPDPSGSSY